MGENTKIEWATHTFNPWVGCAKVSPGCDHCYAEGWAKRSGSVQWGPHAERRRTTAVNWRQPLKWNREAKASGTRPRVFCASLADVFDNAVPTEWRADLFALIRATPHLDWLLVTKRIGNVPAMLPADWGDGYPNAWLLITVTDQAEADRDIPKLRRVRAAVRGLSIEPLLGPVDLTAAYLPCPNSTDGLMMDPETGAYECCRCCDYTGIGSEMEIDWVIVGGESGHNARPMHLRWARDIRDQCAAAGVPFLFKQWGEWAPDGRPESDRPHIVDASGVRPLERTTWTSPMLDRKTQWIAYRVGKKAAGRLLDGVQHDGYPDGGAA